MASGIYCYLKSETGYPEIQKVSEANAKLTLFYPSNDQEISTNLPSLDEPSLLLFDPVTLLLAGFETMKLLNDTENYIIALVSQEEEDDENIKFFNLSPKIGHLIPYDNKSIESELAKLTMILDAADVAGGLDLTVEKILASLENKKPFI